MLGVMGLFVSYKRKFWRDNRAVLGFAADSIEHLLVEGISFPSSPTRHVLLRYDRNGYEKQQTTSNISEIAQCLL